MPEDDLLTSEPMTPARIGIDCRKILDYGIGTITSNLIKNLALVDTEDEYSLLGDPAQIQKPGHNFTVVRESAKRYSISESIRLPLKARKLRLDLLHWLHYASSPLKPCRYVISIHDINHLLFPELLRSKTARLYAKSMLRLATRVADRIITASNTSKAEIVKHLHVPEDKISVIYNGVAEIFKPQPPEEVIQRLKTDYAIEPPYILYVGSLREHKNVARLLEAFKNLKMSLECDHSLVIVGDHPKQRAVLENYVKRNRLAQSVRFLGAVPHDKLPVLYSGAHLFVFPTLYEGFGLPVLEAMACGVPVCASDIHALREVAGDAAAFFRPYEPLDMADVMASVIMDPDIYDALKENGLQRASTFSWRRTAEQTLAVYQEVLGRV
ncbi:MAG TPA: glycosyltransferase family 1 protein [bacterium]|nr:glycosyltransferase family 1 protein [bacterium]